MTRQRLLLIALMLWGIFMVAPDLLRIVKPLSSFGFYANNDGLIYDVEGPFNHKSESPAWKAGVRVGDRVDLERMRCRLKDMADCGDALAVLGGVEFVLPGRTATLYLAAANGKPARDDHPRRGATPFEFVRPLRHRARPDRGPACRDRRRLAGLDAAIENDVGLFPLRQLVQSRTVSMSTTP